MKKYTYNWTIDTTFDFDTFSFYFKVQNEEKLERDEIYSQLFKIRESNSTTKSGGNRTGTSSGTKATVTVVVAGGLGSSSEQDGGLSTKVKVGLCVGVTVGVLFAFGLGIFLGRKTARSAPSGTSASKKSLLRSQERAIEQDLSSLDPKWQNWNTTISERTSTEEERVAGADRSRRAVEVNGQSIFPSEAELTADARRERHELAEREHGRWRGFEYGDRGERWARGRSRS